MRLYCAPMEGLTGRVFRQALTRHFPGSLRFYSPFISPTSSGSLRSHELRDVQPEENEGIELVPQILSNQAEEFLFTADKLRRLGYEEVNLNLGCPSGTVTARGRGAGFLRRREELERFLDRIYAAAPLPVSIKTRVGFSVEEEFPALLALFDRYPVRELIVHPRVREDFYKGSVRLEAFALAMAESRAPVCYNGDIFTPEDLAALRRRFPTLEAVMLGRGLIANPALARQLAGGAPLTKGELYDYHESLLTGFLALGWNDHSVISHMKEYWFYLCCLFPDSAKYRKRIGKAQDMTGYRMAVEGLFREQELLPGGGYHN
ncbi:MAG: tRNA dihydrouridine synthase [Oscillospiraceae bacterium]